MYEMKVQVPDHRHLNFLTTQPEKKDANILQPGLKSNTPFFSSNLIKVIVYFFKYILNEVNSLHTSN